jgi:hypothetical protein
LAGNAALLLPTDICRGAAITVRTGESRVIKSCGSDVAFT